MIEIDVNKTYNCIANCPELDCTKYKHCTQSGQSILDRMERFLGSDCPCGNITNWIEINIE